MNDIDKILEAEKKAQEKINSAQAEALSITEKVIQNRHTKLEELNRNFELKKTKIVKEITEKITEEINKLKQQTQKEITALKQKTDQNKDSAIKLIIKSIVQ